MEQFGQISWFLVILVYLPTSIFKSWEESQNCVSDIHNFLSFIKSKYSSNPEVCFNKQYVSNFDVLLMFAYHDW